MLGIALLEFFNTTGCIIEFLFACKKRVTGRADLHPDIRLDRTYLNFIATGAYSLYLVIFRMYIILHISIPPVHLRVWGAV